MPHEGSQWRETLSAERNLAMHLVTHEAPKSKADYNLACRKWCADMDLELPPNFGGQLTKEMDESLHPESSEEL